MNPVSTNVVPRHVAIIMDGNGRWATQRGQPRLYGHEAGVRATRAVVRACRDAGIGFLTLYAFCRFPASPGELSIGATLCLRFRGLRGSFRRGVGAQLRALPHVHAFARLGISPERLRQLGVKRARGVEPGIDSGEIHL